MILLMVEVHSHVVLENCVHTIQEPQIRVLAAILLCDFLDSICVCGDLALRTQNAQAEKRKISEIMFTPRFLQETGGSVWKSLRL